MDREDARFTAHALEGRITGDREQLDGLCASSLMRLSIIATIINKRNDEPWPPATAAADELMAIVRKGGRVVDTPLGTARLAELETFVASMRKLAGEDQQPRNRHERRRAAKLHVPRVRLFGGARPLVRIH